MKKILVVLVILLMTALFCSAPLFARGLGKGGEKFLGGVVKVYVERAREREDLRRQEREVYAQNQREIERERIRNQMDIERNRAQIQMEQERAEAIKRQEQLRDLQFQQQFEMEQERQERERQLRRQQQQSCSQPQQAEATNCRPLPAGENVLIVLHVFRNGTCQIEGQKETFRNVQELKIFCEFAYPNQKIMVKVVKHK